MTRIGFEIVFDGSNATNHEIDFYDVSRALMGFQRSLAITAHAVINNEVITQAPSLKNATILLEPPESGSWKTKALVTFGGLLVAAGSASKDSMFGNLMYSAYDYVVSESMGFHVDYDKTLMKQYEDAQLEAGQKKTMTEGRLNDVVEKCDAALRDIHRPIAFSRTAQNARIICNPGLADQKPVGPKLDISTYEYMSEEIETEIRRGIVGRISSYNSNTYKGRVFVGEEGRAVPFELSESTRSRADIILLMSSFSNNAVNRNSDNSLIEFSAILILGKAGQLKRYLIVSMDSFQSLV